MHHHLRSLLYLALLFLVSCKFSPSVKGGLVEDTPVEGLLEQIKPIRTDVEVEIANKRNFKLEYIAEGILKATHKVDLSSKLNNSIIAVNVHNGDLVKKGQILFLLDTLELSNQYKQICAKIEKAELDYQGILIDMASVDSVLSEDATNVALLKSGLKELQLERDRVRQQISETKIVAPIDGQVANLSAQLYNKADGYKTLCTIIAHNSMVAEVEILETQLSDISIGQKIKVIPASSDKEYNGYIKSINPTVDKNGLITLEGVILQVDQLLLDGMKATVVLQQNKSNQLVVPREAVVKRQGKDVIFLYQNEEAIWKYVEKGAENEDYVVIEKGINAGDSIIITGNINLGHQAPVVLAD